jgi:hypothetical protein
MGAGERTRDADLERLRDALLELDVSPERLRADPTGASWLPEELRALVARSDECRFELTEFVAMELELFDDSVGPTDALFTARVMEDLPAVETTDAWRRTWILAAFHALAIGVAYLVLWPMLQGGELTAALDQLHGLHDWRASIGEGALATAVPVEWFWAVGIGVACVLAIPLLLGGRSRRVEA